MVLMKKIMIVCMAASFPEEKGAGSRFYYLAELLKKEGYQVLLVTSSFQHFEKRQRDKKKIKSKVKYRLAYQPSYQKNISLLRIDSLRVLCRNMMYILKNSNPDIVYCSIPDNRIAAKITKCAKERGCRTVLDVEDLWPEAMEMYLKQHHLSFARPLLLPYRIHAKIAYQYADAYVGTSDEYAGYADRYDKRNTGKPRKTVYVGSDIDTFDKAVSENIKNIKKSPQHFWVVYAGTIGVSYDIKTLADAAILLKKQGYGHIYFKILGDGETREALARYSARHDCNVEFLGYQSYEIMAAYLARADVLINSFVKSAPQSIVTKIGDYLSSARPMINTCSSREFRNLVSLYKIGLNVEAECCGKLADAILKFYLHKELRQKYGRNARKLAEEKFDRKTAYKNIAELIGELSDSL